jgi:hypothetical protein
MSGAKPVLVGNLSANPEHYMCEFRYLVQQYKIHKDPAIRDELSNRILELQKDMVLPDGKVKQIVDALQAKSASLELEMNKAKTELDTSIVSKTGWEAEKNKQEKQLSYYDMHNGRKNIIDVVMVMIDELKAEVEKPGYLVDPDHAAALAAVKTKFDEIITDVTTAKTESENMLKDVDKEIKDANDDTKDTLSVTLNKDYWTNEGKHAMAKLLLDLHLNAIKTETEKAGYTTVADPNHTPIINDVKIKIETLHTYVTDIKKALDNLFLPKLQKAYTEASTTLDYYTSEVAKYQLDYDKKKLAYEVNQGCIKELSLP